MKALLRLYQGAINRYSGTIKAQESHTPGIVFLIGAHLAARDLDRFYYLLYVCPHTTIYMSSYYYMCVLILLYVSSCYYMCVLILLYICPHTTACVSSYYYLCADNTICVLMLLYL